MLNIMWECDLLYVACIIINFKDDKPLRIPSWMIQLPSISNGFGCPRPGFVLKSNLLIEDVPVIQLKVRNGLTYLPQHMTDDWISVVSEKLPEIHHNINSTAIRESMFNINYYGVLKEANFGADIIKYKCDWAKYKDSYPKYGISEHDIDKRYFQLIYVPR